MPKKDLLKTYRKKRDFKATPEPSGKEGKPARRSKQQKFVIQKHDATRLHYDFRIEAEGVLKSWAVPKGPSLNPQDKRLAVPTEDHPMSYGRFEGVIPEGNYGGGTVIVWDIGTYINLTGKKGRSIPVEEGLAKGHIKIHLKGKKLQGAFALTRTSRSPERWLLVKINDSDAKPRIDITAAAPNSALTGKPLPKRDRKKAA